MISVHFMKPFYSKIQPDNRTLRLVFAYQYFSINKDEEIYHFIPIEGKEILIDLNDNQVTNLGEVFVFQKGNSFIRLPLYKLLLVSNVQDFLNPIIERRNYIPTKIDEPIDEEIFELIKELEKNNILKVIDDALKSGDKDLFYKSSERLKEYEV